MNNMIFWDEVTLFWRFLNRDVRSFGSVIIFKIVVDSEGSFGVVEVPESSILKIVEGSINGRVLDISRLWDVFQTEE